MTRTKKKSNYENVEVGTIKRGDVILINAEYREVADFSPHDAGSPYVWLHFSDGRKFARSIYSICRKKKGEAE